jgi:CheY-like chemotaxis protein
MYRVLIADDDFEDRELLKQEIERALGDSEKELRFFEAVSVSRAQEILKTQPMDLLTLDIEFDRMDEGIDALPGIFENHPTLNIVVISGKLNKAEVSERLFKFTRDNVLKGKRWARHFDVLDKKDDKTGALMEAYKFAFRQQEASEKVRDLILLAEGYMDKGEADKCIEVYEKIQGLAPGEHESEENIRIMRGDAAFKQAQAYMRRGENVVAALLLGHYLESRLKAFTRKLLKRSIPGLYDCFKELERARRISSFKKDLFQQILKLRNKAIHHPGSITEEDFEKASKDLKLLEAKY